MRAGRFRGSEKFAHRVPQTRKNRRGRGCSKIPRTPSYVTTFRAVSEGRGPRDHVQFLVGAAGSDHPRFRNSAQRSYEGFFCCKSTTRDPMASKICTAPIFLGLFANLAEERHAAPTCSENLHSAYIPLTFGQPCRGPAGGADMVRKSVQRLYSFDFLPIAQRSGTRHRHAPKFCGSLDM